MPPMCDIPWNQDSEGKLEKVSEGAFGEGQSKHAKVRGSVAEGEDKRWWSIVKIRVMKKPKQEEVRSPRGCETRGEAAGKGKAGTERKEGREADIGEGFIPKWRSLAMNRVWRDYDDMIRTKETLRRRVDDDHSLPHYAHIHDINPVRAFQLVSHPTPNRSLWCTPRN